QRQVRQLLLLLHRQVEVTARVAPEVDVLRVLHHADDRRIGNIFETDSLSDHIDRAEEVTRHLLVDNHDLRSAEQVAFVEVTPGQQRYAEDFEVIAGHNGDVTRRSFTFARLVAFHDQTELVPTTGDRCVGGEAR